MDRGPIPSHKASFSDDFELVTMRHMDFRRSPNPSAKELRSFQLVIDKAVWWFYKKNVSTCADMGLEIEDLKSYGMQWTCNYLGLYRSELGRAEDEKNLCQFLKQRFIEFGSSWTARPATSSPCSLSPTSPSTGAPTSTPTRASGSHTDPEADDAWEIPGAPGRRGQRPSPSGSAPRRARVSLLNARLAELPHADLVSTLRDAVDNDRIHLDARRAASKKLQAHARKCVECSKEDFPRAPGDGSVPNNLPIQDEAGTVFASAKGSGRSTRRLPEQRAGRC